MYGPRILPIAKRPPGLVPARLSRRRGESASRPLPAIRGGTGGSGLQFRPSGVPAIFLAMTLWYLP